MLEDERTDRRSFDFGFGFAQDDSASAGDRKGRPYERTTDRHSSDVGHWFAMTKWTV